MGLAFAPQRKQPTDADDRDEERYTCGDDSELIRSPFCQPSYDNSRRKENETASQPCRTRCHRCTFNVRLEWSRPNGRYHPLAYIQSRLHDGSMLGLLLVISAVIAGVSVIAGGIACVCRSLSKSNTLSLVIGTLAIPALVCTSFVYWVLTMEADDASPGSVVMGNMTAIAIVTPIAAIASHFTIKWLSNRPVRDGR